MSTNKTVIKQLLFQAGAPSVTSVAKKGSCNVTPDPCLCVRPATLSTTHAQRTTGGNDERVGTSDTHGYL